MIGLKEMAKIPDIFVRNMMCIYQDILFSVIIVDSKTFVQMWFWDPLIYLFHTPWL